MKTLQNKKSKARGFTLIELLVVITIIAILAGIAVPAYTSIQKKGEQIAAISNAKQIALALRTFAIDYDGIYPDVATNTSIAATGFGTTDTSTDNFNVLIGNNYMQDKQIFWLASEYAGSARLIRPDADTTTPLAATENAWAYTVGLSSSSNPQTPLVYTRGGSSGTWPAAGNTETEGGIWDGKIISVNGAYSAKAIRLDSSGAATANGVNIFTDPTYGWGTTVRTLTP